MRHSSAHCLTIGKKKASGAQTPDAKQELKSKTIKLLNKLYDFVCQLYKRVQNYIKIVHKIA